MCNKINSVRFVIYRICISIRELEDLTRSILALKDMLDQTDSIRVSNLVMVYFQLYEISDDPKRKEFLDDLFQFMQKRGKSVTFCFHRAMDIDENELQNLFKFTETVAQKTSTIKQPKIKTFFYWNLICQVLITFPSYLLPVPFL